MHLSNKLQTVIQFYEFKTTSVVFGYYRYLGFKLLIDKLYDDIGARSDGELKREIKEIADIIKTGRIKPKQLDNLIKILNDPICDTLKKHTVNIRDHLAL